MDKFYLLTYENSKNLMLKYWWKDALDYGMIRIPFIYNISSKFEKIIHKVHFSSAIENKINLPFKMMWKKRFVLKAEDLSPNDNNYLIFDRRIKYPPKYIKLLKERYNCRIVTCLFDTVEFSMSIHNTKELKAYVKRYNIDKIYSFDFADCEKYGIEYALVFSKLEFPNDKLSCDKSAIYYVGDCRSDNRRIMLENLAKKLDTKGVKYDFNLVGVPENLTLNKNITYNKRVDYAEALNKAINSNCILDLVHEGQTGASSRYYEAVVYNKKLLTNNPNITQMNFYDPDFMKIIKSQDDIDVNWLLDEKKPEYNYKNEFSPLNLLNRIKEDCR